MGRAMNFTVTVTDEQAVALRVMTKEGTVEAAIRVFAETAAGAVKQVGAWERDAMVHIFGDDFEKQLEPFPGERSWRRVRP
jgi:hypothetical protein